MEAARPQGAEWGVEFERWTPAGGSTRSSRTPPSVQLEGFPPGRHPSPGSQREKVGRLVVGAAWGRRAVASPRRADYAGPVGGCWTANSAMVSKERLKSCQTVLVGGLLGRLTAGHGTGAADAQHCRAGGAITPGHFPASAAEHAIGRQLNMGRRRRMRGMMCRLRKSWRAMCAAGRVCSWRQRTCATGGS